MTKLSFPDGRSKHQYSVMQPSKHKAFVYNLYNVRPTLYKCYTNVLYLLGSTNLFPVRPYPEKDRKRLETTKTTRKRHYFQPNFILYETMYHLILLYMPKYVSGVF